MDIKDYLSIARKEAEKSVCKYRLGAIVFSYGKVISKGFNRYKDSNIYAINRKGCQSIHAEQIALNRTGAFTVNEMLVVRLSATKTGFSMAFPCKKCLFAARRMGIKTVYYTDWLGELQKYNLK